MQGKRLYGIKDKNLINTIWVDMLSLTSVLKICNLRREKYEVYFLEKIFFIEYLIVILNFLRISNIEIKKINYDLGEMPSAAGESIRWQVEGESSRLAIAITQRIIKTFAYAGASKILPKEKLELYFEKKIKKDIYPMVRFLCIAKWNLKKQNITAPNVLLWRNGGIFDEVEKIWNDKDISLSGYRPIFRKKFYLQYIKAIIRKTADLYERIFFSLPTVYSNRVPKIGIHYVEGIYKNRRSDLCWYYGSGIDPKNLLFVIDTDKNARFPLPKIILEEINLQGIDWVCLDKRAVAPKKTKVWKPRRREFSSLEKCITIYNRTELGSSSIERWTLKALKDLIKSTVYWMDFFKEFNIKVYYDIAEGAEILPQSIALQLMGGLRIGRQRSEHFWNVTTDLGSHHYDVYFCWNKRQPYYLKLDRNRINYSLISGFPEDRALEEILKKGHSIKKELAQRGAKFIIALFDNAYGRDFHFSKNMIEKFYLKFLDLLLYDKEIGIIIKRKKIAHLDQLPAVKDVFLMAQKTERCVIMGDLYGRLAAEASIEADISVGIGISSAVMEGVIIGGRGIHCDLPKHRFHLFYEWGYEKIIFDDIDRLILSLKRYKENPQSDPLLGDWSSYMDMVEPFRDGKGGKRIGNYMRCLLESFNKGQSRDEAVHSANEVYAKEWGEDKVFDMGRQACGRCKLHSVFS